MKEFNYVSQINSLFDCGNVVFNLTRQGLCSLDKIVAALRAGAEYAGKPVQNCVLIAGSQSGVAGALRIGMPCVVLRSR